MKNISILKKYNKIKTKNKVIFNALILQRLLRLPLKYSLNVKEFLGFIDLFYKIEEDNVDLQEIYNKINYQLSLLNLKRENNIGDNHEKIINYHKNYFFENLNKHEMKTEDKRFEKNITNKDEKKKYSIEENNSQNLKLDFKIDNRNYFDRYTIIKNILEKKNSKIANENNIISNTSKGHYFKYSIEALKKRAENNFFIENSLKSVEYSTNINNPFLENKMVQYKYLKIFNNAYMVNRENENFYESKEEWISKIEELLKFRNLNRENYTKNYINKIQYEKNTSYNLGDITKKNNRFLLNKTGINLFKRRELHFNRTFYNDNSKILQKGIWDIYNEHFNKKLIDKNNWSENEENYIFDTWTNIDKNIDINSSLENVYSRIDGLKEEFQEKYSKVLNKKENIEEISFTELVPIENVNNDYEIIMDKNNLSNVENPKSDLRNQFFYQISYRNIFSNIIKNQYLKSLKSFKNYEKKSREKNILQMLQNFYETPKGSMEGVSINNIFRNSYVQRFNGISIGKKYGEKLSNIFYRNNIENIIDGTSENIFYKEDKYFQNKPLRRNIFSKEKLVTFYKSFEDKEFERDSKLEGYKLNRGERATSANKKLYINRLKEKYQKIKVPGRDNKGNFTDYLDYIYKLVFNTNNYEDRESESFNKEITKVNYKSEVSLGKIEKLIRRNTWIRNINKNILNEYNDKNLYENTFIDNTNLDKIIYKNTEINSEYANEKISRFLDGLKEEFSHTKEAVREKSSEYINLSSKKVLLEKIKETRNFILEKSLKEERDKSTNTIQKNISNKKEEIIQVLNDLYEKEVDRYKCEKFFEKNVANSILKERLETNLIDNKHLYNLSKIVGENIFKEIPLEPNINELSKESINNYSNNYIERYVLENRLNQREVQEKTVEILKEIWNNSLKNSSRKNLEIIQNTNKVLKNLIISKGRRVNSLENKKDYNTIIENHEISKKNIFNRNFKDIKSLNVISQMAEIYRDLNPIKWENEKSLNENKRINVGFKEGESYNYKIGKEKNNNFFFSEEKNRVGKDKNILNNYLKEDAVLIYQDKVLNDEHLNENYIKENFKIKKENLMKQIEAFYKKNSLINTSEDMIKNSFVERREYFNTYLKGYGIDNTQIFTKNFINNSSENRSLIKDLAVKNENINPFGEITHIDNFNFINEEKEHLEKTYKSIGDTYRILNIQNRSAISKYVQQYNAIRNLKDMYIRNAVSVFENREKLWSDIVHRKTEEGEEKSIENLREKIISIDSMKNIITKDSHYKKNIYKNLAPFKKYLPILNRLNEIYNINRKKYSLEKNNYIDRKTIFQEIDKNNLDFKIFNQNTMDKEVVSKLKEDKFYKKFFYESFKFSEDIIENKINNKVINSIFNEKKSYNREAGKNFKKDFTNKIKNILNKKSKKNILKMQLLKNYKDENELIGLFNKNNYTKNINDIELKNTNLNDYWSNYKNNTFKHRKNEILNNDNVESEINYDYLTDIIFKEKNSGIEKSEIIRIVNERDKNIENKVRNILNSNSNKEDKNINITNITAQVYKEIENKMKHERKRRGMI